MNSHQLRKWFASTLRLAVGSASVCIVVCVSSAVHAAPTPSLPPSPGTVIAPIDKPVYQPERTQTPEISREVAPAPAVPESSIKVRVNSFKFEGNTTFSDQKLKVAVAEFEGQDLSIADIYHVADVVERLYRYNGYLLTSVYVPPQQINSGSITLEIIEGRLGEVKIKGELSSYSKEFLARQVDDMKPGEVISDADLETETLLLGDLPGLETRAVIAPGAEYGTSDIVFINEEKRYTGVISANNYGRKSIGEARVEGGFMMANPIFEGDMLNLSGIIAQDSRMYYGRIDYDALVNTSGTRVGLSYSSFKYDVDVEEIGFPSIESLGGNGSNIILSVSHPIQRSTRNNTTIIIDGRSSMTDENGTLALRKKNTINLFEVFVNYDHLYSNYAKTSIFGGLATNFKSIKDQLDRKSQKAKLTLDVRHYQPFLQNWFVIGRAQGAYSPDPLVDVERYRIGGQGSVRAFPSAELAGDKGGVISLDVGINFIASDKLVLTPKVFADAGKVYRYNKFGFASLKASESLAGYGAGLSAIYARNHSFDLEVVTPTTDRDSSDGRDTRFWLNYRGIF